MPAPSPEAVSLMQAHEDEQRSKAAAAALARRRKDRSPSSYSRSYSVPPDERQQGVDKPEVEQEKKEGATSPVREKSRPAKSATVRRESPKKREKNQKKRRRTGRKSLRTNSGWIHWWPVHTVRSLCFPEVLSSIKPLLSHALGSRRNLWRHSSQPPNGGNALVVPSSPKVFP